MKRRGFLAGLAGLACVPFGMWRKLPFASTGKPVVSVDTLDAHLHVRPEWRNYTFQYRQYSDVDLKAAMCEAQRSFQASPPIPRPDTRDLPRG